MSEPTFTEADRRRVVKSFGVSPTTNEVAFENVKALRRLLTSHDSLQARLTASEALAEAVREYEAAWRVDLDDRTKALSRAYKNLSAALTAFDEATQTDRYEGIEDEPQSGTWESGA